ncbi:MAG TPA: hypothetical protein VFH10_04675 [Nocardioides sp.]|uniref:hypothetical protein n=1 Tax=Nocardioides sp. TaxID=35761 RepID=UPI002D805E1F|nr:hypothetical protein [Nocardioides sp.]HET6651916.1 hypothetical protein [Nocardioides sp.]
MVRPLALLLAVALAALTPTAAATGPSVGTGRDGAQHARVAKAAKVAIEVDWPSGQVRGRNVRVHVTRQGSAPTRAELQVRRGTSWVTVARRNAAGRTFTMTHRVDTHRYKLRVALTERGLVSRTARAPQPPALVRDTSYPSDPVKARGRRLDLRFEGERGDHVDLVARGHGPDSCTRTVLRKDDRVVRQQRSQLWRLPRTGSYRLLVVPCWGYDLRSADLTRFRLVPLMPDGAREPLDRRRGTVDVAVVDVPSTGRMMVRGWTDSRPWARVLDPDGRRLPFERGTPTYLETGRPAHSREWPNQFPFGPKTLPGRYLFVPERDTEVSLSTPVAAPAVLEGAPVTVADGGVPGREREIVFSATAGAFVYPDLPLPSFAEGGHAELVGPDGAVVHDWNYRRGWLLPSDGSYRLYVTPGPDQADQPLTVRLRSATLLPAMSYDAAPTRFTATAPGRWAVAEIALPSSPTPPFRHRFVASAPDTTGAWDAVIAPTRSAYCSADPHGPLGCGDYAIGTVRPDAPVFAPYSTFLGLSHLVVFRPDPTVTGTVDLSLGPDA